jgi:pyruvate dehydrogenase E2 component (dihydrolipoamide acetyltransferase)
MAQQQAFAGAQQPPGGVATAKGETTEIELSRAQQSIARRASESKATIPHLVLETEIDMHECAALRERLAPGSPARREDPPTSAAPARREDPPTSAAPARREDPPTSAAPAGSEPTPATPGPEPTPTYEDMIVKACALALREHPRANSSYRDGRLQVHARVNVGLALWPEPDSPDGAAGVAPPVTPTLFDADLKSVAEIARETRVLAERARVDAIAPPELSGATFTIASLGAFPVKGYTAIINPPQVAILAVGTVELRPVAHAGAIVARHTITATLACDGRALNGADAAGLLARIRALLEQPQTLRA